MALAEAFHPVVGIYEAHEVLLSSLHLLPALANSSPYLGISHLKGADHEHHLRMGKCTNQNVDQIMILIEWSREIEQEEQVVRRQKLQIPIQSSLNEEREIKIEDQFQEHQDHQTVCLYGPVPTARLQDLIEEQLNQVSWIDLE